MGARRASRRLGATEEGAEPTSGTGGGVVAGTAVQLGDLQAGVPHSLLHARVADSAAHASLEAGMDFSAVRLQLMVDATAALVVLAVVMILGFVKPRGTTPWAARPAS